MPGPIRNTIKEIPDREPIWRRIEERVERIPHELRQKPDRALEKKVPDFENRNFGGGVGVGAVEAAVAIILEDTVGIPFGASTEITDAEPVKRGTIYTVNVDAPFQSMAEAEAFVQSGTGFASFLTDLINVEETEVIKTRILRDTFQVKVRVED